MQERERERELYIHMQAGKESSSLLWGPNSVMFAVQWQTETYPGTDQRVYGTQCFKKRSVLL